MVCYQNKTIKLNNVKDVLRCVYITSLLLSSSCFIAYLDGTHREYNGNNEKQNSSNKPSGNSPSFKIIWQMILQRLADTVPIQRVRKHTKEHVLGSSNIFHWNKKIVSLNGAELSAPLRNTRIIELKRWQTYSYTMLLLDQFGYLLAIAIHHPVYASLKKYKNWY